jgi:predicted adenine nucleotide alpha hydrolase (AANH) superfamily ATPase
VDYWNINFFWRIRDSDSKGRHGIYCEESSNVDIEELALVASMQDWQSLSSVLLRADPTDRLRFSETISGMHKVLVGNLTSDREKVILPSLNWKTEVKYLATLKDGSVGWVAFQQL